MKYGLLLRIWLAVGCIVTLSSSLNAQEINYPDWFKSSFLDLPEDLAEAFKANRHVALVFHQDGCPYCQALVERNFSQQNIVNAMKSSFDAIALNMWGDLELVAPNGADMTEKELAEYYQVQFTPTILFLNNDGTIRLRLNGYVRPPIFMAALTYVGENISGTFSEYLASLEVEDSIPIIKDPLLIYQPAKLNTIQQGGAYALLFEQADCVDCKALHESVLTNTDTRALLERLPTAQLDRFSRDEITDFDGKVTTPLDLANHYRVNFTPTWILFNPEGEEVLRLESTLYNFHTQAGMEYVLDEVYIREPAFQRYIIERGERIRESGKEVNVTE